eukprot:gene6317-6552_t
MAASEDVEEEMRQQDVEQQQLLSQHAGQPPPPSLIQRISDWTALQSQRLHVASSATAVRGSAAVEQGAFPSSALDPDAGVLQSTDSTILARMTLLVCLLLVALAATQYMDAAQLQWLIESIRTAPLASALLCIVLFGAAVVLLLPGMLLSIGAGAAYGFHVGFVVAWCGTVLGQAGAFMLGRYLLRDVVYKYMVTQVPHFAVMDQNISNDGWRLVLLLRLSPVLPYNVMNYVLGLTSIGLLPYIIASAAAAVPYVCLFCYLGSVSSDVYHLLISPTAALLSPSWLIGLACVMVLSAAGLFLVCKHAVTAVPEHATGAVQADAAALALGPVVTTVAGELNCRTI